MTLTISGSWESKGRPPSWLKRLGKWAWRAFYWTKRGKFSQSWEIDGEGLIGGIDTNFGSVLFAYVDGDIRALWNGLEVWRMALVKPGDEKRFSLEPLPGQTIKGTARIS